MPAAQRACQSAVCSRSFPGARVPARGLAMTVRAGQREQTIQSARGSKSVGVPTVVVLAIARQPLAEQPTLRVTGLRRALRRHAFVRPIGARGGGAGHVLGVVQDALLAVEIVTAGRAVALRERQG